MDQHNGSVVSQALASAVMNHVIGKAARRRRVRNQSVGKPADTVLVPCRISGFNDSVCIENNAGAAIQVNQAFREIAIEDAERQAKIRRDAGTIIAAAQEWRQVSSIGEGNGVARGIQHSVDQGDETAGREVSTQ